MLARWWLQDPSLRRATKGLVGGAASGSADNKRNWTVALIPRSLRLALTRLRRGGLPRRAWHGVAVDMLKQGKT